MNEVKGLPLKCEYVQGAIRFVIGEDILKFSAAHHPDFWDGASSADVPNIKVSDPVAFAREVVQRINDEDEVGNTLLTMMLDEAMKRAVEDGCEGVEHE